MKKNEFIKRTRFNVPVEELFKWHERPGAIERLSPPWTPVRVLSHKGGIKKGAEVILKTRIGMIPVVWKARHTEYIKDALFRDIQVKGPFSEWIHTHRFHADGKDSSVLEDRVTYRVLPGIFGRLVDPLVRRELERMFNYRHRVLKTDLERHRSAEKPLTFLISGAGGVIGSALVPFLKTGGHRVVRLVRKQPDPGRDEIFWDPYAGVLDLEGAGPIDVVINFSGENIATGRWDSRKKRTIVESRTVTTSLIAEKIAQLSRKPEVFISSSAIGYYGDWGDRLLTERDAPGDQFISEVCDKWEKAGKQAQDAGIRTVFMRIGVVLTPAGGALSTALTPFLAGLGSTIGDGSRYMSWVSMDDVTGAIWHMVFDKRVEGPVNVVSPHPVTNREFTETLARVLRRPVFLTFPSSLVEFFLKEKGREILLSSMRVKPESLEKSGYEFTHDKLDVALKEVLGKG